MESSIWENYNQSELDLLFERSFQNGFDEMIKLTNEGKIWKLPVDNEQGDLIKFNLVLKLFS